MTTSGIELVMGRSLAEIASEVERSKYVEYRDGLIEPYGIRANISRCQNIMRDFTIDTVGEETILGILGAKGSGKTYFGSWFANHQGQTFPESIGMLISSTYTQANDNGGQLFVEMCDRIGYRVEFFNQKKIRGKQHKSLYAVDLDGKGFQQGLNFYLYLRSFDAIDKLEGTQPDWLWVEEVQQATEEQFNLVLSRVRGKYADNSIFVAGMPDDGNHWMYDKLPKLGAIEEEKYNEGVRGPIPGILLEPSVFENRQNLPPNYIDRLYSIYDEEMADRFIHGKRTSNNTNKVCYTYDDNLHRAGVMSQVLCDYDPNRRLIAIMDFNTNPFCVSIWQVKDWPYILDSKDWIMEGNFIVNSKTNERFVWMGHQSRKVMAQIAEYEIWGASTQEVIDKFVRDWGHHTSGIHITGDATADRKYTSADKTDWEIIRNAVKDLPACTVSRGVMSSSKKGKVTFENPPRRDSINILNAILKTSNGQVHMCFLPKSEFRSGGLSRSVSSMVKRPDGEVDSSCDKQEGKEVPRTHFFDVCRYSAWWFKDNGWNVSLDAFKGKIESIVEDVKIHHKIENPQNGYSDSEYDDYDDIIAIGATDGMNFGSIF